MTELYLNNDVTKNGGLTNDQIRKATRGIAQTGDVPAITVTPTACIGPDVIFNDVANSGVATGVPGTATNTARQGVALCDPNGYKPAMFLPSSGPLSVVPRSTGLFPLLLKPTPRTSCGTLAQLAQMQQHKLTVSGSTFRSSGTLLRRLKPLAVRSAVMRCTTVMRGLAVAALELTRLS